MRRTLVDERGGHSRESGFTLVELLVVIAIIGILATLITPMVGKARDKALKTQCLNNLSQIAKAAQAYADDFNQIFPWSKPIQGSGTGTLTDDDDARACLELIYKLNYLDDPKIYICTAAAVDKPAEHIEDLKERKDTFHLEEYNCSYTYRNKLTTVNSGSKTPISGDKRGGQTDITNHKDGRHVVYRNANVEFFTTDKLEDANDKDAKTARNELIGFSNVNN